MTVETAKVVFQDLPERLRNNVKSQISEKETILFCLLVKTPASNNAAVVVTDYQLVIACIKGGPFDYNDEMYISFNAHRVSMRSDSWVLSRGLGGLGPIAVHAHNPLFGKSGWKIHFDLGYRDSMGIAPLKLFVEDKALADEFVGVFQRAKNDDFVRSKTPIAVQIPDIGDQLMKLAGLLEKGRLTQAEFEAAKKKLLS